MGESAGDKQAGNPPSLIVPRGRLLPQAQSADLKKWYDDIALLRNALAIDP
jgi:hypothetical protein